MEVMSDPECQNNCVRDSLEDQGKLQEADSIATRSDGKVEFRKRKKGIVDRRKNLSEKVKVGTCWLWHGEARTSVRRMRRHYCRSKGLRGEARFGRKGRSLGLDMQKLKYGRQGMQIKMRPWPWELDLERLWRETRSAWLGSPIGKGCSPSKLSAKRNEEDELLNCAMSSH